MGTRPNSGIIGIIDLLQSKLKVQHISRFTFFKDGYNKNYRDKIDGVDIGQDNGAQLVHKRLTMYNTHNQTKIISYLREFLKDNQRVELDEQVRASMV